MIVSVDAFGLCIAVAAIGKCCSEDTKNATRRRRLAHKAGLHGTRLISCLPVAVFKQFPSADIAAWLASGYHSNLTWLKHPTIQRAGVYYGEADTVICFGNLATDSCEALDDKSSISRTGRQACAREG
jgi:hypothetical protein